MEDDLQIAAGLRRIERQAASPDGAGLNGKGLRDQLIHASSSSAVYCIHSWLSLITVACAL